MTDWQLLQQYVQAQSQEAFAELVRRHSPWIRAAARRQVRDEHLADDVTQAVLLALAQQARRMDQRAALSTWLFQVTRYAARAALRARSRRIRHEQQAAAMIPRIESEAMSNEQWQQLAPMLDALVARLGAGDQRAVVLRFYEQKSYPQMAATLGVSEEAARKRTDRAVEKLRQMIERREIALSAGALSAGLLAHVADAAPLAIAPSPAPQVAAITKGALQMMTFARLKLPAAITLFALLLTVGLISFSRADAPAVATSSPAEKSPSAPAAPAATAPATQPAGALSPKALVIAAYSAGIAGDADAMLRCFDRVTPQQEQALRQIAALMAAADDLNNAVREKFGADMERQLVSAIGSGVRTEDVTGATETITGDTAVVDIGSGPGTVPCVKVGSTWKISGRVLQTLNVNNIRQIASRLPQIKQLAADIRAGKYKDINELQQAMRGLVR